MTSNSPNASRFRLKSPAGMTVMEISRPVKNYRVWRLWSESAFTQQPPLTVPTNCDNLHAPRDGGHGEATPLRSPTLPGYRMPGAEASASTAGNECVLKMQKPVSLTYHLLIRLGNRKVLRASTLFKKFFRQNPTRKCGLDA